VQVAVAVVVVVIIQPILRLQVALAVLIMD
jgi:hypothetical protein